MDNHSTATTIFAESESEVPGISITGALSASVTINSPSDNAIVGGTITVNGTASCQTHIGSETHPTPDKITKVEVQFGNNGSLQQATLTGSGNPITRSWSFTGTTSTSGNLKITAIVTAVDGSTSVVSDTWVEVDVDRTRPTLTIDPPGDVAPFPPHTTTLTGQAFDAKAGVRRVQWRLGNSGSFQLATKDTNTWSQWHADVVLPGLGSHTVVVRATDKAGNTKTESVTLDVGDTVGPELIITNPPQKRATVIWADGGVTVAVSGGATDAQSGVDVVEWDLNEQNQYTAEIPQVQGDWSTWSASVPIATPGNHTMTVRARDVAGNSTAKTLHLAVVLTFEPTDPLDVVRPAEYLRELISFAEDRVITDTNLAPLNPSQLTSAFYQPFTALTDVAVRQVADQPVHQVRLCIEVLRHYFTAHAHTPPATIDESYRQTAYRTLLRHLGTSYEELRSARVADHETRTTLANRLGFMLSRPRPDQLDRLFLQPDQLTEADLERLFGLADTTRDPLQSGMAPEPELITWQRAHLRTLWRQQDDVPRSEVDTPVPLIDPDLLGESDLRDPVSGNPAYGFWQARQQWIAGRLTGLQEMRDKKAWGTALEEFDGVVSDVLGSVQALLDLAEHHGQGHNIAPQLATKQLRMQPFLYLMRLRDLAADLPKPETLLDDEWAEVDSILVQVSKYREYTKWRMEERRANLTLGPDYFTSPTADGNAAPPPVALPSWRATAQARHAWQQTLESRINQEQVIIEALQATVAATEEATLPALRDAMVASINEDADTADLANQLTLELAIDVKSSGNQQTTRVYQAIETLQQILFSLRMSRFHPQPVLGTNPPAASAWTLNLNEDSEDNIDDYTEADFDEEWQWMGSYTTWRAAMFVFGYPENYLLPSLRDKAPADFDPQNAQEQELTKYSTKAFWSLVDRLRDHPRLTPLQARTEARTYLDELIYDASDQLTPLGAIMPDALKNDAFRITEQLSEAQLADRRAFVQTFFLNTAGDETYSNLLQVPNYLQEIFYFVPILIAQQLQKAGQFLVALDWFQTVYAYNLRIDQRKIYHGLVIEAGIQTQFTRAESWLRDGLNPHAMVTGQSPYGARANAYTSYTLMSLIRCILDFADQAFTQDTSESIPKARALYVTALELLDLPDLQPESTNPFPPNPVVRALRLHAELNLFKLRSGRNIAGMERQSTPQMLQSETLSSLVPVIGDGGQLQIPKAVTFRPTPYRYAVLIERAKQLVTIAQQIEAAFLVALEKFDAEGYNLLKAKQDVQLSRAGVQLQALRVTEADGGVKLAELQRDRTQLQSNHFQGLLNEGRNTLELEALSMLELSMFFPDSVSVSLGFPDKLSMSTSYSPSGKLQTSANISSTLASYERREQEWRFQRDLARHDILTGTQQIAIAQNHLRVVGQEHSIAAMQADHAEETLDFLANKFTSAELYAWMSNVLARVYSYFLQQATSIAQLAQHQLGFERQETPPSFIQADYWLAGNEAETVTHTDAQIPDRRGLTGSFQLLEDIFRLDQYAFETNERKLQLSQTFSLAQLLPAEFQRFRETGDLSFATPMELFDRAFPGHYLRLIKRVSVSVIALIPPTQGIRATLMSSGISRVVIGRETFQTITVRRDPEQIAFTSPSNATGLFELQPEGDMLQPFEAQGVQTLWTLQMPKAANPFNFRTIADVLITIDYTALNSFTYRQEVIRQLDRGVSADRPFSFRHQFVDQWYDLHNPDQTDTPMVVRFETRREDFPPNIDNLNIQHVVLYVARVNGATFELPVTHLHFTEQGDDEVLGGGATTVDGVISTRRSNGTSWLEITGNKAPVGTWELALPNTEEVRRRFKTDEIEDILFVITYSGQTPEWPL